MPNEDLQHDEQHNIVRLPEDVVEIKPIQLMKITETICTDARCRYPQLALRILLHVIAGIDKDGGVFLSAKQLAGNMGVNYNTVTKCLRYLRRIGVLSLER